MEAVFYITIILVPFVISFWGARLVYKGLLDLGQVGAIIWSMLTFLASFAVVFIITVIVLGTVSGVHC